MVNETKAKRGRPRLGPSDVIAAKMSIIAAAAQVYERDGGDAPIEEILKTAGISRATFYKHFSSKVALLEAMLEYGSETMLTAVERAAQGPDDLVERIDAGIRTFLSFHSLQPGVRRVLLAAALPPGTRLHEIRNRSLDRFAALLASEVERAGRAPVSPVVYQALIAAVEGTSIRMLRRDGDFDAVVIEEARAALVRIISATLSAEGEIIPPLPPV